MIQVGSVAVYALALQQIVSFLCILGGNLFVFVRVKWPSPNLYVFVVFWLEAEFLALVLFDGKCHLVVQVSLGLFLTDECITMSKMCFTSSCSQRSNCDRFSDFVISIRDHGCTASRCKMRDFIEYFSSDGAVVFVTGGSKDLSDFDVLCAALEDEDEADRGVVGVCGGILLLDFDFLLELDFFKLDVVFDFVSDDGVVVLGISNNRATLSRCSAESLDRGFLSSCIFRMVGVATTVAPR